MVGRQAEQIDRDHAFGLRPAFRAVAMPRFSDCRIDVEGRRVDVGEHRRRAEQRHHLRRSRRR